MSEIFNSRKILKENIFSPKVKRNCITPRKYEKSEPIEKIKFDESMLELKQNENILEREEININEIFQGYNFDKPVVEEVVERKKIIKLDNYKTDESYSEDSVETILDLNNNSDEELKEKLTTFNDLNKKMLSVLFENSSTQEHLRKKIIKSGFGLVR